MIDIYTNYTVAYTTEDAINIVMQTLQTRDVKIYERGLEIGGWTYVHHHAIPVERLEQMFNDVGIATKDAKEQKRLREKNDLMRSIIEKKNVHLLHENIAVFTKAEQEYLHDKITSE